MNDDTETTLKFYDCDSDDGDTSACDRIRDLRSGSQTVAANPSLSGRRALDTHRLRRSWGRGRCFGLGVARGCRGKRRTQPGQLGQRIRQDTVGARTVPNDKKVAERVRIFGRSRAPVPWQRPCFGIDARHLSYIPASSRNWWKRSNRLLEDMHRYEFVLAMANMIEHGGGPLGSAFRRLLHGRRDRRAQGTSTSCLFPLPPVGSPRDAQRASRGNAVVTMANLLVAVLNLMYAGRAVDDTILLPPTAAQKRVLDRVRGLADDFVLRGHLSKESEIHDFLQHSLAYGGISTVLELDERAGVPTDAATVDMASVLRASAPGLAEQVVRPGSLLLPLHCRPRKLRKAYRKLGATYGAYVRKVLKTGMQVMRPRKRIAKHRGKIIVGGGFAVTKPGSDETRAISPLGLNDMLDPVRLPRPVFAYIPRLRSSTSQRGTRLVVSKVDARHYYHKLRIGTKWIKYMAHPSPDIEQDEASHFPCHRTAPMGFSPSAGWAQGITNVVTSAADLPPEARVTGGEPAPEQFPLWGSIIDDIWAIEEQHGSDVPEIGSCWVERASREWTRIGVEENSSKRLLAKEGAEVQGYYVHPSRHWFGASMDKRWLCLQAAMFILLQHRPLVREVDRLVGKLGFIQSARVSCRSIFEATYSWLASIRSRRLMRAALPSSVWLEILMASIALPFCQFKTDAPWSRRVEATDSSLTGLGRAWTYMPENMVREAARYSDCKGAYTNLTWDHGIELTEDGKCPLKRVDFPIQRFYWRTLSAPWAPLHITLGEADACTWSMEDRLRRPEDNGARVVNLMDSAACIGAFNKGRSPARRLNAKCRKHCAVLLAGGLEGFYPWVMSCRNPSDWASRVFEPWWRRKQNDTLQSVEHDVHYL